MVDYDTHMFNQPELNVRAVDRYLKANPYSTSAIIKDNIHFLPNV